MSQPVIGNYLDMTAPDTELTQIAGYRLVRTLGSGSRSEVYLGSGSHGSVAVKLFRPGTGDADIFHELDVLARLPREHCVRLLDIGTAPSGVPVPILARAHRGSLGHLISRRDSLEAGEAVTLLAPIAATVAKLYRSGVVHGRVSPASIHLGAAGEPVLLGFGHAALFAAPASVAAIESNPDVAADFCDVLGVTSAVLALVHEGSAEELAGLVDWLSATALSVRNDGYRVECAAALESRLFELAEPLPIALGRAHTRETAIPGRAVIPLSSPARHDPGRSDDPPANSQLDAPPSVPGSASVLRRVFGAIERSAIAQDTIGHSPVEQFRARVVEAVRGVRKPVWVVASGVCVALVLALTFIPQGNVAGQADVTTAARPVTPATRSSTPTASAVPSSPVAALRILLSQRAACFRDRSVLCLAGIDEASSSALAGDSTLIQSIESGGQVTAAATLTATAPKLVEVLGDSALVRLGRKSNPASVLMIRDEAGWRIRDFLGDKPTPVPAVTP